MGCVIVNGSQFENTTQAVWGALDHTRPCHLMEHLHGLSKSSLAGWLKKNKVDVLIHCGSHQTKKAWDRKVSLHTAHQVLRVQELSDTAIGKTCSTLVVFMPDSFDLDWSPELSVDMQLGLRRIRQCQEGRWPTPQPLGIPPIVIRDLDHWKQWSSTIKDDEVGFDTEAYAPYEKVEYDIPTEVLDEPKTHIDTKETISDFWSPEFRLLGLSISDGTPQGSAYILNTPKVTQHALGWLKERKLACHNAKYDLNSIMVKYGCYLYPNLTFDTMLAAHQLSSWRRIFSLKYLTGLFLEPELDNYEWHLDSWFFKAGFKKKHRNYGAVPLSIMGNYAAIDALATIRLTRLLRELLRQNNMLAMHVNFLLKMSEMFAEVERNGWGWDKEKWRSLVLTVESESNQFAESFAQAGFIERYKMELEGKYRSEGLAFYDVARNRLFRTSACQQSVADEAYRKSNGKVVNGRVYTEEPVEGIKKNLVVDISKDAFKKKVLFDYMRLTPLTETETGNISVSLNELQQQFQKLTPVQNQGESNEDWEKRWPPEAHYVKKLMAASKLRKAYDAFLAPAPSWVKSDGILHPSFNIAGRDYGTSFEAGGTVGARISSSNPNVMAQPQRGEGIRYKEQFVARPLYRGSTPWPDCHFKWGILSLDYSQIELRVLGVRSGDLLVIEAYENNQDLHSRLACQVFRFEYDQFVLIYKDSSHPRFREIYNKRHTAKTTWFATLYGSGKVTLAEILGKDGIKVNLSGKVNPDPLDECELLIQQVRNSLVGVKAHTDAVHRELLGNGGYVSTPQGRVRWCPKALSNNSGARAAAMREGFNTTIQSEASDITQEAAIRCWEWLATQREKDIHTYFMGTVHDQLNYAVPDHEVEYVSWHLHKIMIDMNPLIRWDRRVPLVVDGEFGPSWGKQEHLKL